MLSFICTIAQNIPMLDASNQEQEMTQPKGKKTKTKYNIHTTFRLPIHYLDASNQYTLSDVVSNDLELSATPERESMYRHLFLPKHEFAKSMILEWNKVYTTNTAFLQDSQDILKRMGKYNELMGDQSIEQSDCHAFMVLWKDIKQNDDFLDKYNYMDWEMLKHLNES
jgi:hypothetical protein